MAPNRLKKFHKKRNSKINELAKNILGDYHHKTHFKAVAEFSTSNCKNHITNIIQKKTGSLAAMSNQIKKIDNEEINRRMITKVSQNEIKNYNLEVKKSEAYENQNEYESLTLPNVKIIDRNFSDNNPIYEEKRKLEYKNFNYKSLEDLKNIAFKSNEYEEEEDKNGRPKRKYVKFYLGNFKNKFSWDSNTGDNGEQTHTFEDRKIILGNEKFNIDELNIISKKALLKCDYFCDKNKNNNRSLKAKAGKLMITHGLSVNEFENKYHLCSSKKNR